MIEVRLAGTSAEVEAVYDDTAKQYHRYLFSHVRPSVAVISRRCFVTFAADIPQWYCGKSVN